MELAAELLEVTSEQELEQSLATSSRESPRPLAERSNPLWGGCSGES